MLGGDAELLFQIAALAVFFEQIIVLRNHLARIANELQAVVRRRDAPAAAVKNRDAETIYFLPYVTNSIALGMVFSVLFASRNGLINSVIVSLGGERISWLTPFNGQSPTYFTCMMVLMIYTVWNGLAFKILVFLSGMQSIDKQYYQAAQIDATPRWRVFRRITVPLLSPMIAYILITSLIGAFKAYSSVIAVFNGRFGPRGNEMMLITMVGYTYEKLNVMSNMNQISQASASALILFAIIMAITAVELWVSKKKVHY